MYSKAPQTPGASNEAGFLLSCHNVCRQKKKTLRILKKRLRDCKKVTFRYIHIFINIKLLCNFTPQYHMMWLKTVDTAFRCGMANKQKSYKCDNQLITWLTGITRPAGSCNLVTLKTNFAQYKNFVCFNVKAVVSTSYSGLWHTQKDCVRTL